MRQGGIQRTLLVPLLWCVAGALVSAQEVTYDEALRQQWYRVEVLAAPLVRGQGPLGQELEAADRSPFAGLFAIPEETAQGVFFMETTDEVATEQQLAITAGVSLGAQLQESAATPSVAFQRRSPLAMDPYIRGYKGGQIYTEADGQQWLSVRTDLDSMISKFDPALIEDVVIVNGPYALRYGPGFSYIAVKTYDTPRYDCLTVVNRTGVSVHTNGGQLFGRETVYGGNQNYGFVVSYANRNAGDYRPGGNSDFRVIPSSFKAQNFLGQYGFDLSDSSKMEVRYNRLDQTDTEVAAQFWDLNYLGTDAVSLTYTKTDDCDCSELILEGWYNRTRFSGDLNSPSKRFPYPVIDRVELAIDRLFNPANPPTTPDQIQTEFAPSTFTRGELSATGARLMKSYETTDWLQVSMGVDTRYIRQNLLEFFLTTGPYTPGTILEQFRTNMPRAEWMNVGAFAESSVQVSPYLKSIVGGRIDFVRTDARQPGGWPLGQRPPAETNLDASAFTQDDGLFAVYLRNDIEVNSNLQLGLSAGYAERAPSLIERYSDGIFIGMLQQGLTRVIGDPRLRKERLWQIDASLQADYENWRGGAAFYYSWIEDYASYELLNVIDPTSARLLRSINLDLATLTGFELKGEVDLTERHSILSTVRYVEGRDRDIDRALPAIVPLELRVAWILDDACGGQCWSTEIGLRMVDTQDQPGFLRLANGVPMQVESRTGGFTTAYLRGYYNATPYLNFVGGVENLFDRNYREHLDLLIPPDPGGVFGETPVLSPGITPYVGAEWTY